MNENISEGIKSPSDIVFEKRREYLNEQAKLALLSFDPELGVPTPSDVMDKVKDSNELSEQDEAYLYFYITKLFFSYVI